MLHQCAFLTLSQWAKKVLKSAKKVMLSLIWVANRPIIILDKVIDHFNFFNNIGPGDNEIIFFISPQAGKNYNWTIFLF